MFLGQRFDYRVSPFADQELIIVRDLRSRVSEALSRSGERSENIEFGDDGGCLADPPCLFGDVIPDFLKKILFDLEDALLGGQNFLFVFLEFRRDEPLRTHKSLL